jgi:hypothetical protein
MLRANDEFIPECQGVQSASTFRGFCDKHDTALFRPVETQPWRASKETAFLLSFRAVSFEVHAKFVAEDVGQWQKLWIDRGFDFSEQADTQQYLEDYLTGVRLCISDQSIWKKEYDRIYLSADYSEYHYLCVEFRPLLPIVACGAMHVEYDFQGRSLQNLTREAPSFEHMTFNITVSDNASIVVFGWVGDPVGPAHEFVRSFLMQPSNRLSHAVIRLAFENFENTFMRQSWWDSLSSAVQGMIKRRTQSGGLDFERLATCLVEDNVDYFSAQPSPICIVL